MEEQFNSGPVQSHEGLKLVKKFKLYQTLLDTELNVELKEIDSELEKINQQIEYLQYEKDSLLKRRDECKRKIKSLSAKSSVENEIAKSNIDWRSSGQRLFIYLRCSSFFKQNFY